MAGAALAIALLAFQPFVPASEPERAVTVYEGVRQFATVTT